MDVFRLRDQLVGDYRSYVESFLAIRDEAIRSRVDGFLKDGLLWPEPLLQLNPSFERGATIDALVADGILHPEGARIFRVKRSKDDPGNPLRLHRHQEDAIRIARERVPYVLTTGTGSGKSLAYIIPIVDRVLQEGSGRGIRAIVVYPMNALANSQMGELEKFLQFGYPKGQPPVRFARYTGQESQEERDRIIGNPPDVILTNYVMLELLLTRPFERRLVRSAQGLQFLVLDELHTYRGRQGADVAMLVRRVRHATRSPALQVVGTSATLAGSGSPQEQREEVARVASQLFGQSVRPEHVIGETLRRATAEPNLADAATLDRLRAAIDAGGLAPTTGWAEFIAHPLAGWIEGSFGLARAGDGSLRRGEPRAIHGPGGAAEQLSGLTGGDSEACAAALRTTLLTGHRSALDPETGFPAFAFRLHQFVSRGDTVFASLEDPDLRHVTPQAQRFRPGDRERLLFPLVFCRECGQEYYSAWESTAADGPTQFSPREPFDQSDPENTHHPVYLAPDTEDLWPADADAALDRLPEDWVDSRRRVTRAAQPLQPRRLRVDPNGAIAQGGLESVRLPAPFRFCPRCGVTYSGRSTRDIARLTTLATGGRSTATTILCLSAVRALRADATLAEKARKLLSFTDNRQDASLQAGHFNDFVEVGLLRAALLKAVSDAGSQGLRHDELAFKVFDALELPFELYSQDPTLRFEAREQVARTLREVLGYRVYRDLERGWRITAPNLEQCGLLDIDYPGLAEVCAAQDVWQEKHAALAGASPETRAKVAHVLLDVLRRELAVHTNELQPDWQEGLQRRSSQHLVPPWGLDENELLERGKIAYPRSSTGEDTGFSTFLSARGGFGQFLRRSTTFPDATLKTGDADAIIRDLLEALRVGGLVRRVREPEGTDGVPGYALAAHAMRWRAGDGTRPHHDPIRVPRLPESGARVNTFFVEFYRAIAGTTVGLRAKEHTAQVPAAEREEREQEFREARLPILYCSPTMELGVDIAELNVVNMRNVPPTPANYAQRSGRAGRSGQPALVFTYCSTGNAHDQYFFRRPTRMVAGAVSPPRIDLANEDLLRAHLHALWLSESSLSLGSSLCDLLDVAGDDPSLALQPHVAEALGNTAVRTRALSAASEILEPLEEALAGSGWYSTGWAEEQFTQVQLQFEQACERWRGLRRAAQRQAIEQQRLIVNFASTADQRRTAQRLRREAEGQLRLLEESSEVQNSDFYSYRYFASEGFLPGYSFPRLPLSAYIPERPRSARREFLSRPRFLAITEFGPRAIVYHEGSRYVVTGVLMVPGTDDEPMTQRLKICSHCGYIHPVTEGMGVDLCEHCAAPLPQPLDSMLRLTNVATRRRDRISSDEEERTRHGYEVLSGVRFRDYGGVPGGQVAAILAGDGTRLGQLTYGAAATIWRINLGWKRRRDRNQLGYVIDKDRGTWARNQEELEIADDDAVGPRTARVIPFVEDRRNALLLDLDAPPDALVLASLESALKSAVQAVYQLEDNELATYPLPTPQDRRRILFYESAEGGAGVLRRLVDDPGALAEIAREALEICHFDPATGEDRHRSARGIEDCEAACYDCLMHYGNQPDHGVLDRQAIASLLRQLAGGRTELSPGSAPRAVHLAELRHLSGSNLERQWLDFLEQRGLRLPSAAQPLIEAAHTRPDFLYADKQTVVYVDGPHHAFPERAARDREQQAALEDLGYTVVRFGLEDDWEQIVASLPSVFGTGAK